MNTRFDGRSFARFLFFCRVLGEQVPELLAGDGFLPEQDLRRTGQHLVSTGQDFRHPVSLLVDDSAHLVVDGARSLVAVVAA